MRTFTLKAVAFSLPFLAVLGVPFLLLALSGELTGLNRALARQERAPGVLYGPAYSNPVKRYKLLAAQRRTPEIVALGSSRVMQFGASFFRTPTHFYNAGGAMATVWDARRFLSALPPEQLPRLMILGVDQWFLNPRWSGGADPGTGDFAAQETTLNIVQRNWRRLLADLRHYKIDLGRLFEDRRSIGMAAVMRGTGFRQDGSYSYGDCISGPERCDHWDRGFADTFRRIELGVNRFEWGETLDEHALAELERLLDFAKAHQIKIVGFVPPFAPSVLDRMRASGHYGYFALMAARLVPAFGRRGFALLDLTDPAALSASDHEFIDGFHGSAKTYLRILLRLAEADADLRAEVRAPAQLEQRLASAGRYEVPEAL
jgi:hypothetical protein